MEANIKNAATGTSPRHWLSIERSLRAIGLTNLEAPCLGHQTNLNLTHEDMGILKRNGGRYCRKQRGGGGAGRRP